MEFLPCDGKVHAPGHACRPVSFRWAEQTKEVFEPQVNVDRLGSVTDLRAGTHP
jgi:hypothetical protein